MRKAVILVLAVVGMGALAFAYTYWSDSGNSTGHTIVQQEVVSGHMKQRETIENTGYLNFWKIGNATPSTDPSGMEVHETKSIFGSGTTSFYEEAVIGGPNWQIDDQGRWSIPEPYDIVTAYIVESIYNEGEIGIYKTKDSLGDWHLLEQKWVSGFGNTTLDKEVAWWSNTERGAPEDRTWVEIVIDFDSVNTSLSDYVWAEDDLPAMQVPFCYPPYSQFEYDEEGTLINANMFGSHIFTDEFFKYFQSVEINPEGHHSEGS